MNSTAQIEVASAISRQMASRLDGFHFKTMIAIPTKAIVVVPMNL